MPSLPKVDKFRGDNSQSFKQWILMFEAQLAVLETEYKKNRETLLCLLDGNAFTTASQYIAGLAAATYAQLKGELIRVYSGDDYKRALETKLRGFNFTKDTNIPIFCNEVRLVITELFGLTDAAVIEKIAINDVLSRLDNTVREQLKVFVGISQIKNDKKKYNKCVQFYYVHGFPIKPIGKQ